MKKVIIIGATSGIGRELAKLYAQNNWLVGVTGRRKELLDSLLAEFPDNIVRECFDVKGTENIECLQFLLQQLGGLDLLIYNSGTGESSEKLDIDIDMNTTRTNVNGFVEIVNFIFNYFIAEGKGHIVAVSSVAGIRGNTMAPAYSASKAYMSNYMEGLYMKVKRMKLPIYITDIQPGSVRSALAKVHNPFWEASVEKAAGQIYTAIQNKKRKAYITRRWRLIAGVMKIIPARILKKIA